MSGAWCVQSTNCFHFPDKAIEVCQVNNFFGKRMVNRPVPVKRLFDYVRCSGVVVYVETSCGNALLICLLRL